MNKLLTKISIIFINFYKKAITPYTGKCCRFYPTCSDYSLESIEKYGFFKGFLKAVKRICRCNKFFKGGYDPVK